MLFESFGMKHNKYFLLLSFLFSIAVFLSCVPKEIGEPPASTEAPEAEDIQNTAPEIEQTAEEDPKKEVTAVTYPREQNVQRYEPGIKEDTWFLVGGVTGDRAYSVFVDPETIVEQNGIVNSWSKLKFEKAQRDEDGLSYKEVQISSDVDCERRTYSYVDSKFYDSLGRLVETQRTPYEPQPIIDGTVSAEIADFVCGYELNRPK